MATPRGWEILTPASGGVVALASVPAGADSALIRAEASARWMDHGGTPNATLGLTLNPADGPLNYAGNFAQLRFAVGAGGAIQVAYRAGIFTL